jgi:hypothetical protein
MVGVLNRVSATALPNALLILLILSGVPLRTSEISDRIRSWFTPVSYLGQVQVRLAASPQRSAFAIE